MDTDIKRPARNPDKDPLPDRKQELMSARMAIVELQIERYFWRVNKEMEWCAIGDQTPRELEDALEAWKILSAEKIVKILFS